MPASNELRQALYDMVKRCLITQAVIGEVRAVDADAKTCEVLPFGAENTAPIKGVRLQAKVDDGGTDGILLLPAVGSDVIVAHLGNDTAEAYVAMFTRVERIAVKGGGGLDISIDLEQNKIDIKASRISVEADKITLNGGNNGGTANVPQIRAAIETLKLNFETLKAAIQAAPVFPGDGGATFKASLALAVSALQPPDTSGFEDSKIVH